jgi:hypothetical protein
LGPEQIREFFLYLLNEQNATPQTNQQYRSALKFLYVKTLRRSWFDEDVAPVKTRWRLPPVLSAGEITCIPDQTNNLKHWIPIATLCATGLGVSELCQLRVSDIASTRMLIHVRKGNGRIPRDIALSPSLLERLRVYWRHHQPKDFLFPSTEHPDSQLDVRTIRLICRDAARRAGINKRFSPHVFSRSAASRTIPRVESSGPTARKIHCWLRINGATCGIVWKHGNSAESNGSFMPNLPDRRWQLSMSSNIWRAIHTESPSPRVVWSTSAIVRSRSAGEIPLMAINRS